MSGCVFKGGQPDQCGQPAVALHYQGTAENMFDEYFRPMCAEHINLMSWFVADSKTVPLDLGGTWVVALRSLPDVPCPACDGSGQTRPSFVPPWGDPGHTDQCGWCRGTGVQDQDEVPAWD